MALSIPKGIKRTNKADIDKFAIINKKIILSNTGLIRQFKQLNKNNNRVKKPIRKPVFWSFVAIVISLISLYSQFFFINHDLRLNLVDGDYKKDTLRYQIIYHNRGNQDATILTSSIELYKKDKKKTSSIKLEQRKTSLILSSGRQKYEEMKIPADLSNYDLSSWGFNWKDTLAVELSFQFLNDNSYPSEQRFECGWIKLDSTKQIEYYLTNLNSIELESDIFFTRTYRTE